MTPAAVDRNRAWVVAELHRLAALWNGFDMRSIAPHAISRLVASLEADGWDLDRIGRAALDQSPELVRIVRDRTTVNETYLFRHPEAFEFLAQQVVPRLVSSGVPEVRAWSAGCATGEEAYSLAAMLVEIAPTVAVRVLGTDLLERNLAVARAARYTRRALRASTQPLYPVFAPGGTDESLMIRPEIRAVTTFARHDLLHDPAPLEHGPFHIIMCRNVLVYFAPEPANHVCRLLASALDLRGVLMFAAMDRIEPPPGVAPMSTPDLQAFRLPPRTVRPPPPPPPLRGTTRPRMPSAVPAPTPVALHVVALRLIEGGDMANARRILDDLCASSPDYVPGLVERALLLARQGELGIATSVMRDVVTRTDRIDAEQILPGPEPLPVGFYRGAAQSFLGGRGRS